MESLGSARLALGLLTCNRLGQGVVRLVSGRIQQGRLG
jgi:hypothetical protein